MDALESEAMIDHRGTEKEGHRDSVIGAIDGMNAD